MTDKQQTNDERFQLDALTAAKLERVARSAGQTLREYLGKVLAEKAARLPG